MADVLRADAPELHSSKHYHPARHAAARTTDYVFNQLIPYIGNKRRLLDLIGRAIDSTGATAGMTFLDLFAGSGVVSRFAKRRGFRVISNDWEPHTRPINTCHVACNQAPPFTALGGYQSAIDQLNDLPPRVDWVTTHLCPRDDEHYDVTTDRMFFMRKNGMRLDAIRHQIANWKSEGKIDDQEEACLVAPLLYQACYRSNTSGVFKGFHRGWGGQTKTALYRIATDLKLMPAVFHDNCQSNQVHSEEAESLARKLSQEADIAYIDPPYNQHPYSSNYHVLTSIALWDKPPVPPTLKRGGKSAIREDWRQSRRSPYNHRDQAAKAYADLLSALRARYILTSYSTDGTIPLDAMLDANADRGLTTVFARSYKRYRVSSQRYSEKPLNIEFILLVDTQRANTRSPGELRRQIENAEKSALVAHAGASRFTPSHPSSSPPE